MLSGVEHETKMFYNLGARSFKTWKHWIYCLGISVWEIVNSKNNDLHKDLFMDRSSDKNAFKHAPLCTLSFEPLLSTKEFNYSVIRQWKRGDTFSHGAPHIIMQLKTTNWGLYYDQVNLQPVLSILILSRRFEISWYSFLAYLFPFMSFLSRHVHMAHILISMPVCWTLH